MSHSRSARRIVITRSGGPDVLSYEAFEPTPPGPGEVSIDVAATGINFADIFCRLGLYAAAPPPPFTPGFEVAGVVTAVGDNVTSPRIGDRVIGLTRFGGYTSQINLPASWTRPLPDAWSFEQGAAFPVVFLTAWHGLVNIGRLAKGETVVVQTAAGGVGTAACRVCRELGARVIGTVGSATKRQVALDAGAHEVVVSREYRVWPEVDRLTDSKGVDLVFDAVGGRGLKEGWNRLALGGRLVVYGFAEMMPRRGIRNWPLLAWRALRMPRFNPFQMTATNKTVAGFNLVFMWKSPELFQSALDALFERAEAGSFTPVVGATYPFEQVVEAHDLLQSRRSTGKVAHRI